MAIIALLYLSTRSIITINYDTFWNALAGLFGFARGAFSWLIVIVSIIPFAGSFVVGLLLGFKLG